MLIGIDVGQSACKVIALEPTRGVVSTGVRGYPTAHPQPGWAEQDPDDWVRAAAAACHEAVDAAGAGILGVAVTGATHQAVLVDGLGRPVRPCITLRDGRAGEQTKRIGRELGGQLLRRARNSARGEWTAAQLAWVREYQPDAWRRTRGVLFAKDYVRSWLTGEQTTDHIDAEGSLLLNARTRSWDPILCAAVPIDLAWLPPVLAPGAPAGQVRPEAAGTTGLPPGTPVLAGCSDTAAEALACGAVAPGDGVVKLATAGNLNIVSAQPQPSSDYYCYSHPVDDLVYHSYGTNAAASARAWLQDLLGAAKPEDYAGLDREAARIRCGSDGLLFHPYLYGERAPVFDPSLRASFIGLSAHHGRAHLLRAVLEGVALSLADCARSAPQAGLELRDLRIIGGGARSHLWRQIVADALGRPLLVPRLTDASAGAAMLAGVGTGVFADPVAAARELAEVVEVLEPDDGRAARYAELLELYRRAQVLLAPISKRLGEVVVE